MIITTHYATRDDGVELFRTYSDAGFIIRQEQTGKEYVEAIDVENSGFTYAETDKIAVDDLLSAEDVVEILMGGGVA